MSEEKQRGLQRIDIESKLPPSFQYLSEAEKKQAVMKIIDQDIKIREEFQKNLGKSFIAEHDLAVFIEGIGRLDQEKKIYSANKKGETGSGTYELKIRGGDTKFIIPIMIVIGVIILGIIVILSLK